jgi:stage III sporulation protein AH
MNEELSNINQNENIKKKNKKKKDKPILTEAEIKKRKVRKTRASVAAFVLLLGVGIMGNWYYENTDLSNKIEPLINSTQTKTLGEAEYVDSPTEISTQTESTQSEYFSSARVERQTARDESLEKLQAVVDSTDESEEAHNNAEEEIAKISSYINIENKIETLVSAKGVNNCLAVISEDGSRVDVIVDVEELTDTVIIQIKEIAIEQLGCTFENVSIIQSN